jgi:hypothetical protein
MGIFDFITKPIEKVIKTAKKTVDTTTGIIIGGPLGSCTENVVLSASNPIVATIKMMDDINYNDEVSIKKGTYAGTESTLPKVFKDITVDRDNSAISEKNFDSDYNKTGIGYISTCMYSVCPPPAFTTKIIKSNTYKFNNGSCYPCLTGFHSVCSRNWEKLYDDNPDLALGCCLGHVKDGRTTTDCMGKLLKPDSNYCDKVFNNYCKGGNILRPVCVEKVLKNVVKNDSDIKKYCIGDRLNREPCISLCKATGVCEENRAKYCIGRNLYKPACATTIIPEDYCAKNPHLSTCKKYCMTHDCDNIYKSYCSGRGKQDSYCACLNSSLPAGLQPECFDRDCSKGSSYLTMQMRKTLEDKACPNCTQVVNAIGTNYRLQNVNQALMCDNEMKITTVNKTDLPQSDQDDIEKRIAELQTLNAEIKVLLLQKKL